MKIGIHKDTADGCWSWSNTWTSYCEQKGIAYKIVDAYKHDIIEQLSDCDIFMWHFHQEDYKDVLFAKELIYSLEHSGKKVYPNFKSCWHFDDKLGQKYLLESLGLPLVPSYIFFTKQSAKEWVKKTDYPFVFKLRGGASSTNVKLVRNKKEALRLIKKAFGKGFIQYDSLYHFKEELRKYRLNKASLRDVIRPLYYLLKKYPTEFSKFKGNEKGYFYTQKFMPNNNFDVRVNVIGNKAFGFKRINREGDFRASGSEHIIYGKDSIDIRCVKLAFEANKKIESQSCTFDFVFDENNNPLIVEISYGTLHDDHEMYNCGYWDDSLNWINEKVAPLIWTIENILYENMLINR